MAAYRRMLVGVNHGGGGEGAAEDVVIYHVPQMNPVLHDEEGTVRGFDNIQKWANSHFDDWTWMNLPMMGGERAF